MPTDELGTNVTVGAIARINLLTNRPFVWWHRSIHKLYCCISLSIVPLWGKRQWPLWGRWWWPTVCSQMPQLPPHLAKLPTQPRLPCCIPVKSEKLQPSPRLVVLCWMDDANLCEADDSELATAHSWTPLLPLSLKRSFQCSEDVLLPCCILSSSFSKILKVKQLEPFQKDDQFLKYCTTVMWRAWFDVLLAKQF